MLAAQEDARQGPVRPTPPKRKGGIVPAIVGTLLLVSGGGGAYYAYTQYLVKTAPVGTETVITSPIFVNETQPIAGRGEALTRAIVQSLSRPPSPGAVRQLSLSATTTNVFFALDLSAPDILLRNLALAPSIAGVMNVSGTPSVFFVLPAQSYADTFAGMLLWEPTMLRDLGDLYPPLPSVVASTTASTTPKAPPRATPGFVDEVVGNHDARVYRDEEGRSRMLYGYWNERTLVVARDPEAFAELIRRFANSRTK